MPKPSDPHVTDDLGLCDIGTNCQDTGRQLN